MAALGGLLEREADVRGLLTAVGDVSATGRGRTVLVTGEAGIGKTSVIRAFLARLGADDNGAGVRVLAGACDDLRTPRTLGPLSDAVTGTGGPLDQAIAQGRTEAVFDAVLTELAGPRPTVLLIEDVHWADDATLDVLRYLVRRLPDLPAVLVLSFRDGGSGPLRQLLAALAGGAVQRLALRPLSVGAVAALAADSGLDPDQLHRHTHGNPFYLSEVLAAGGQAVPATVADAVLARVGALPVEVVRALEQLSVVPSQLEFGLATALLGAGLEALAEAERSRVIRVGDDGIAFRHELARRAVEQSLPAITRRRLNTAMLRVLLAAEDPDLARVVHHAVEADDVPTILTHAPRAAREAARQGAHGQAVAHFETVLPHAERLAEADRAALLEDAGTELQLTFRYADAARIGRQAVALRERMADPTALAESLLLLSRHQYLAGDTGAALATVESAAQLVASADVAATAEAAVVTYQGVMLVRTMQPGPGLQTLERALPLATAADRPDLVVMGRNFVGLAHCDLGDPRGLAELRANLDQATAAGDQVGIARAYCHLVEVLYRTGGWREARGYLERGLEFTRERSFWGNVYNLEVHQALLAMRSGDWAGAEEQLRRLVDGVADPGMLYVYSIPAFGRLLARRGDTRAEPLLTNAWDRAREQTNLLGFSYAGIAYVEWAWLTGRPELAAPVQERLLRKPPKGIAPLRAELERYLARAGLGGTGFEGCPAPYAAGLRGDWESAAAGWERIGDPYEQALELAESGRVEPTRQALAILDRLGAEPAAALVRDRLRDLGVRVPRGKRSSTRTNPAGLTDRQLDVLALLADGLTNAEIAARLVVSVRTVDHHVAAILTKLGVRTRRDAAAEFPRLRTNEPR